MKYLHLCNDFLGSKVHRNLYEHIASEGIDQVVFFASRKGREGMESMKHDYPEFKIISTDTPLKFHHRLLFRNKIRFTYKKLLEKVDLQKVDFVHATTLFSDGALAYRIYRKFKIPYAVAIRATDLDLFMTYRPDLIPLSIQILKHAQHIIFISDSLRNKLIKKSFFPLIKRTIVPKFATIYNGINEFWIRNRFYPEKFQSPIKLLFVGNLVKRKHPVEVIKATIRLNNSGIPTYLTIAGDKGSELNSVLNEINKHPELINYAGVITDLKSMQSLYRSHDIFTLPSVGESFGLVYLEAISQGLPILIVKNQAVDGILNPFPGVGIPKPSPDHIANGVQRILNLEDSLDFPNMEFEQFSWKFIAKRYISLFEQNKNHPALT